MATASSAQPTRNDECHWPQWAYLQQVHINLVICPPVSTSTFCLAERDCCLSDCGSGAERVGPLDYGTSWPEWDYWRLAPGHPAQAVGICRAGQQTSRHDVAVAAHSTYRNLSRLLRRLRGLSTSSARLDSARPCQLDILGICYSTDYKVRQTIVKGDSHVLWPDAYGSHARLVVM